MFKVGMFFFNILFYIYNIFIAYRDPGAMSANLEWGEAAASGWICRFCEGAIVPSRLEHTMALAWCAFT